MSKTGIALIGCGAIAEAFHLPALVRHDEVKRNLILVDPSPVRTRALAGRFGVSREATDYRDVLSAVNGAVIATPHHLHAPVALACIAAGVHVLCEKPIAETAADARSIARAAADAKVVVAVNNTRRLFPSFRKVSELLGAGEIGSLRRMELVLGEQFDWPAASGSYFGRAAGGKGVLLDTGAHVVDLACWWAGGQPVLVDYEDDSMGGTEAVAGVTLAKGDCSITIHLSWLSKLSNTYRIEGDRGIVQGEMYDSRTTRLVRDGRTQVIKLPSHRQSDIAASLIDNFLAAVTGRARPLVNVDDVLPSIELIEECYERRRRMEMPWFDAWERVVAHA